MSADTRERILAVANELFIDQGYEGTSLREIADRLDITKAALYYHFRSKDEILATLLEPFDTLLDELLRRLEDAHDVEAWADALTWVVGKVFDYLDFFRLVDRNRHIVEVRMVEGERDHAEMHARVEAAAHAAAASVSQEVRMVAALGAVTGFDDWAPTLLKEADPHMLQQELGAVVRDVLGLSRARAKRTRARVSQPA
jgi:AcrR family transcriptional regulator